MIGTVLQQMTVNSGRIQETDMYIIAEEANEQTRMYSHFVATRMTTGEWPPFFYSSGKWTCSIVIYSSASRYMYERIHCQHHWQTTRLSGIDAAQTQYALPRKMWNSGLNGWPASLSRSVQSFISSVSRIIHDDVDDKTLNIARVYVQSFA